MPYTLTKTNGLLLTTVNDASLNVATDLFFVGKNYAGYGNAVNENFVKLLENFSNVTPPSKPIQGELWFNSSNKSLNVYDGSRYKGIANIFVQSSTPTGLSTGDLWWDTSYSQLKTFDGNNFQLIGPTVSPSQKSIWSSIDEPNGSGTSNVLEAVFAGTTIVTISDNSDFSPGATSSLSTATWPQIIKGITLPGANAGIPPAATANAVPGSTRSSGYYFWGTAAESLYVANVAGGQTGQILIQSDPDTTSFISLGAANTVLVSNGSTATFTAIAPFISANIPTASNSVLGGVKVGTNLTISGDGTLSADNQAGTTYAMATANVAGGSVNLKLNQTFESVTTLASTISISTGTGISVTSNNTNNGITITNTSPWPKQTNNGPGYLINDGGGGLSWGNIVAVHAYQSNTQTVAYGQVSLLENTQIFNNTSGSTGTNFGSAYNVGSSRFQPSIAGIYQLHMSFTINLAGITTATGYIACGFGLDYDVANPTTNAIILSYTSIPVSSSAINCVSASTVVYLDPNSSNGKNRFVVPLIFHSVNDNGIGAPTLSTFIDTGKNPVLLQRSTFSAMGMPVVSY
jgi:hypothetical protein